MDLNKPLAFRMSPKTLEDYVGQEHILGKDKILYRTIKADRLSSIILWGPPGCGKTSLARVISNTTKYKFTKIPRKSTAPIFLASSSKTRMNSSPMILRLRSGSVTPASLPRKRGPALTRRTSTWNWFFITC